MSLPFNGADDGADPKNDHIITSQNIKSEDNNDLRFGTVAIVGRPNVGKSTLLNALIKQKLSITSRKPQTTRHRIIGVLTESNAQFVFVDTPGFQTKHNNSLNKHLNRTVKTTLYAVDLIVYMVEAPTLNEADRQIIKFLSNDIPVLAIINKIDQVKNKTELLPYLKNLSEAYHFAELIPISAKSTSDVAKLLPIFRRFLPQGEAQHSADTLTDRSERFLATEIIREKIFRLTGDEIPYNSTVIIDQFEQQGRLRRVFASIIVNRNNHKMMVIGAKGAKLKQISMDSRLAMEALFDGPVYLEIFVKVKSGWADNEETLRSYGYE